MKVCTKCKIEKPLADFYKSKRSKDGHKSQCKACKTAYIKTNKDRLDKYVKRYHADHREDINKQQRKRYAQKINERQQLLDTIENLEWEIGGLEMKIENLEYVMTNGNKVGKDISTPAIQIEECDTNMECLGEDKSVVDSADSNKEKIEAISRKMGITPEDVKKKARVEVTN